jgi:transcriptional regulator with XRE-family HTH domain
MPETERWDGGDRLRQAIERWHGGPEGIEAFVKALKEHASQTGEKFFGANRAMVQRYLGNKAAPSVEFLREAAKVLGVRFAWLAIKDGAPTEAEAAMRPTNRLPPKRDVIEARMRAAFPQYDQLDYWVQAAPMDLVVALGLDQAYWARYLANDTAQLPTEKQTDAALHEAASVIGSTLREVLERFRSDEPDNRSLEDYVLLMCQALKRLVPTPAERREWARAVRTKETPPE